jgi:hypothetical protein
VVDGNFSNFGAHLYPGLHLRSDDDGYTGKSTTHTLTYQPSRIFSSIKYEHTPFMIIYTLMTSSSSRNRATSSPSTWTTTTNAPRVIRSKVSYHSVPYTCTLNISPFPFGSVHGVLLVAAHLHYELFYGGWTNGLSCFGVIGIEFRWGLMIVLLVQYLSYDFIFLTL